MISSNSFRSSDLGVMGPARFQLRHAADVGHAILDLCVLFTQRITKFYDEESEEQVKAHLRI